MAAGMKFQLETTKCQASQLGLSKITKQSPILKLITISGTPAHIFFYTVYMLILLLLTLLLLLFPSTTIQSIEHIYA